MHIIVVDLGYGDAGKGATVAALCRARPVRAVVRFNGGPQAAHNVVTADGRHHTFAQFGAGTLSGTPTHLSRFTAVDPLALAAEADHLRGLGVADPYALLTADRAAPLVTPYHAAAGRRREELRGAARHGSCGMGVGESTRYALAHPGEAPTAGDCADRPRLLRLLRRLRDRLAGELGPLDAPPVEDCADAFGAFARTVTLTGEDALARMAREGRLVFEGAQGVLLDEWHGFHPYTTWSTTTFANAETLLAEAGDTRGALRLGVLRTTTVRHGPGPHVTEDPALGALLPEPHNRHGRWQGAFRTGHFDAVAHRYAVEVCGGIDALALTHLDAPARCPSLRICTAYGIGGREIEHLPVGPPGDLARQEALTARLSTARPARWSSPGSAPGAWPEAVSALLGAPVLLESHGPADQRLTRALPASDRVRPC
ncbi:adenylosuccinate synthetase [Actinacidiphila guanduensis]|uniref:Adenylosuccinate synthetase n=1 Tax=Actinacidiphila guanduensis TaxID=310781 RepID=A0A1H0I5W6_9ACTN|nr:adenylosuccinate synthetase [Actinacidiphila guanduensis]SDO26809.1 adenylosuccinate synthase [Actinacidiphila guanduensis]